MKTLGAIVILGFLLAAGCGHYPHSRRAEIHRAAQDLRRASWEARIELQRARRDLQRDLRQAREDFRREMRQAHRDFRYEFDRW